MCTLVVIKNVFPGYPLVVAANRDEQFSRPSAAPAVAGDPRKVLSPTDLRRGGTWIGVNDAGVLVALTNRKSIASVRGLRSRGELVAEALTRPTAKEALSTVIGRKPGEHNACFMVIADPAEGFTVAGNGVGGQDEAGCEAAPGFVHDPLPDGLSIVTNLGLGAGSPRGAGIMREWEKLSGSRLPPPRFSAFIPMLTRHEGERLSERFRGREQAALCLHPTEDDADYGTVSSSVIRLSQTHGAAPMVWHYWHGSRRPGKPSACHVRWSDLLTLPIRSD